MCGHGNIEVLDANSLSFETGLGPSKSAAHLIGPFGSPKLLQEEVEVLAQTIPLPGSGQARKPIFDLGYHRLRQ
jgi:hypothetical protein